MRTQDTSGHIVFEDGTTLYIKSLLAATARYLQLRGDNETLSELNKRVFAGSLHACYTTMRESASWASAELADQHAHGDGGLADHLQDQFYFPDGKIIVNAKNPSEEGICHILIRIGRM